MGIIANIFAGLIGSSVGQSLFGSWGPRLAGMALIPSILGAVIVVAVVSFFLGKNDWTWTFLDRNRLKFKFYWWKDSICQKTKKYFTLFYVF